MNAWLLAALFFPVRGSAAVVESARVAAPVSAASVSGAVGAAAGASGLSPIQAVPGAAVLAPSLNAAVIRAFQRESPSALPAGAVRLAPPAAVSSPLPSPAAPGASVTPSPAAAPSRSLPPEATAAARPVTAGTAPTRSRDAARERAVGALASRLEAAQGPVSAPGAEAAPIERMTGEAAADLGRRIFDRSVETALPAGEADAPGSRAAAPAPSGAGVAPFAAEPLLARAGTSAAPSQGEVLRDAVASPLPLGAAARPGAFPAPASEPSVFGSFFRRGAPERDAPAPARARRTPAPAFERLTLEFGAGLVVKVRTALGLTAAVSPRPFSSAARPAAPSAAGAASREGTPVTSTEWLERRGLLESLSASEAAAGQAVAAAPLSSPAAPRTDAPARAPAPAVPFRSGEVPAPALWLLAFLPAAFVLSKELL